MFSPLRSTLLLCLLCSASPARATDWPQFRGPNAAGSADSARYPARLLPDSNLRWKIPLPAGISSPCIVGARIYLTAVRGSELLTLALDRDSGALVWERKARADRTEEVHQIGSPATPTPACDGERVYVFFGSFGLLAYDLDGNEEWALPLGPFKNGYGQASSPIVWRDRVILNCDQDIDSFCLAAEKSTGKILWRNPRPGFPRGFSTPVVSRVGEEDQVLVAGTLRMIAYDPRDGSERWSVRGLARIVNSTPVLGGGLILVSSYAPGGDSDDRISMSSFAEFTRDNDKDKDGFLAFEEVPDGPFRARFPQLDADKNGKITQAEWESMQRIFEAARNSIFAVKPDGKGDVTDTHVVWRYERATPYTSSPLYHNGLVYILKDGGIFTCLDAVTGKLEKQARLPAGGNYYASPVVGSGLIYTVSRDGGLSVIQAGRAWDVVQTLDLKETCMATPALVDGRIYLRSEKHLYAFEDR